MKTFLFILSFAITMTAFAIESKVSESKRAPASTVKGTAQVAMNEKYGWVRIEGEAAKAMYEALSVTARNDNEGAGETTFIKRGKSYVCVYEKSANAYQCDFAISDFSTGQSKN